MIVTIDTEVLKETLKSNCYTMCIDRNTDWCEHSCPLKRIEDLLDKAIVDAERPQSQITQHLPSIHTATGQLPKSRPAQQRAKG